MACQIQEISNKIKDIHRNYIQKLAESTGVSQKQDRLKNSKIPTNEHVLLIVGNYPETALQLWKTLETRSGISVDRTNTSQGDQSYDQVNFMVYSSLEDTGYNGLSYHEKLAGILQGQKFRIGGRLNNIGNFTVIIAPYQDRVDLSGVLKYCRTLVFAVSTKKRVQLDDKYRDLLKEAQRSTDFCKQKLVYVAMDDCLKHDFNLSRRRDDLVSELAFLREKPEIFYTSDQEDNHDFPMRAEVSSQMKDLKSKLFDTHAKDVLFQSLKSEIQSAHELNIICHVMYRMNKIVKDKRSLAEYFGIKKIDAKFKRTRNLLPSVIDEIILDENMDRGTVRLAEEEKDNFRKKLEEIYNETNPNFRRKPFNSEQLRDLDRGLKKLKALEADLNNYDFDGENVTQKNVVIRNELSSGVLKKATNPGQPQLTVNIPHNETWIDSSNGHFPRIIPAELEDVLITPIDDLHPPEFQLQSNEMFQKILVQLERNDGLIPLSVACSELDKPLTKTEVDLFIAKVYEHNKPKLYYGDNDVYCPRSKIKNGSITEENCLIDWREFCRLYGYKKTKDKYAVQSIERNEYLI